jgi:acyl dehydratase
MNGAPPPTAPGAVLPEARRCCDLVQSVRMAGATENYHRIHWEHAYAQREGLPGAIVNSGLLLAWLEALVEDTYGPAARLTRLQARFRKPVLIDEPVRCGGSVEQAIATAGGLRLALRLWVGDAADAPRVEATAAVELPR